MANSNGFEAVRLLASVLDVRGKRRTGRQGLSGVLLPWSVQLPTQEREIDERGYCR